MSAVAPAGVLLRATVPTARTGPWLALLALTAGLLLVAGLFRVRDLPASDGIVAMGAAGTAAVLVLALRDPADALLAATPVSRLTRRLLRLGLVAAVAVPAWLGVTLLLPGDGRGLAPLLALSLAGVAAATWLPVDRDVLPAVALPLGWAVADRLLGSLDGAVGAVAGAWTTHPWPVAVGSLALVALGRHR